MTRALVFVALIVALLAQKGDAQSVTVAWDAAVDQLFTIPEYRVYRNGELLGGTADLQMPVPVAPGEPIAVAVSSYGWQLDEDLNVVWAEGAPSTPVTYQAPSPPAPVSATWPAPIAITVPAVPVPVSFPDPVPSGGVPPYATSCSPASGSLFWDGETQVACQVTDAVGQVASGGFGVTVTLVPPPADTIAPVVTLTVNRNGRSANWSVSAQASDAGGVVSLRLFLNGNPIPVSCAPTSCGVNVKLSGRGGTYVFEAVATDAAGNEGAASRTVTN